MPFSTIQVYRGKSPASNERVSLGFSGGQTRTFTTDRHGQAHVEHSHTGTATVYVNGRNVGTFHAPGRYSVSI